MAVDTTLVFPFDRDYKTLERQLGELSALKAEVELLRSVLMEDGKRDVIKAAEKALYKRNIK